MNETLLDWNSTYASREEHFYVVSKKLDIAEKYVFFKQKTCYKPFSTTHLKTRDSFSKEHEELCFAFEVSLNLRSRWLISRKELIAREEVE